MSPDFMKFLALLIAGVVGYLWALRSRKEQDAQTIERIDHEIQENEREVKTRLSEASIDELVRDANERLRKRRSSGDDL